MLVIAAVAVALACAAPPAGAATFSWIQGYDEPATPDALDRVGVLLLTEGSGIDALVIGDFVVVK